MPSFIELVTTGSTYEHWSRFLAMSFLCGAGIILAVTKVIDYSLDLIAARVAYLKSKQGLAAESEARV